MLLYPTGGNRWFYLRDRLLLYLIEAIWWFLPRARCHLTFEGSRLKYNVNVITLLEKVCNSIHLLRIFRIFTQLEKIYKSNNVNVFIHRWSKFDIFNNKEMWQCNIFSLHSHSYFISHWLAWVEVKLWSDFQISRDDRPICVERIPWKRIGKSSREKKVNDGEGRDGKWEVKEEERSGRYCKERKRKWVKRSGRKDRTEIEKK